MGFLAGNDGKSAAVTVLHFPPFLLLSFSFGLKQILTSGRCQDHHIIPPLVSGCRKTNDSTFLNWWLGIGMILECCRWFSRKGMGLHKRQQGEGELRRGGQRP
ncbi:hypothetical protein ABEB36_014465 [Hypothenemus hampei]|uniref:Uncharacterized protein n=1 Tax=Hypothenemus hampei TaxID=57062 RepID=A0ABD1E2U3_HYPHA